MQALFTPAVIRGMFARAIDVLGRPDKGNSDPWDVHSLGRFAAWAAAVEGHVELIPEVVQFLSLVLRSNWSDSHEDYEGPLQALKQLVHNADPPEKLATHASARVRRELANSPLYARLRDDRDLVVRAMARYPWARGSVTPWWSGILPAKPPKQPAVLKFGALAENMPTFYEWSKVRQLTDAFRALPADLSGRIARWFVTPLWDDAPWAQAVWSALLRAPSPLAERRRDAEEVICDLVLPSGFPRVHYEAIERAIDGCPPQEQAELASLLDLPRARLEPTVDHEVYASWAERRRVSPKTLHKGRRPQSSPGKPPVVRYPRGLIERLIHELVRPGIWGESRFALHPRARWELGRGLRVLDVRAAVIDRDATLLDLADLVAMTRAESPLGPDATQLALVGLLGALASTDPIFATLASHPEPMMREAAALGLAGTGSPLVRQLVEDAVPEVWMAARMAIPDSEPWRGPLVQDPFEGCSTPEAQALVPKMVALATALPRVRCCCLQDADFVRLGAVAAALPPPHGLTLALRLLPERGLEQRLAPLVRAILNTEGGVSAWAAEIDQRLKRSRSAGMWLCGWLVQSAAELALPDGESTPLAWQPERRWAAACDALARYTRTLSQDRDVAGMWLRAAAALWPNDRDPLALPGPWRQSYPDGSVRDRLATMQLGTDWPVTRAILDGAREGFPRPPWAPFNEAIADLLARLPEETRIELALEGFWRDDEFGQWARQRLGDQLSYARTVDPAALHTLLSDPRLAPARLVQRDRTKHTLFVRRARLAAGLADFSEALLTLSAIATHAEAQPWTAEEIQGWRSRWVEAIQLAMAAGPGGPRGVFLTLAPPALWQDIDRAFVHAVAHDATPEEAQAIARRLAMCGDAEDLAVARELSERHPAAARWPDLLRALAGREALNRA